ncbi:hypothetical protein Avbf_18598 [Armadillidium vulgare]|nr:hypothetical protein Avbf_18598 [Armadillidium vulgare]
MQMRIAIAAINNTPGVKSLQHTMVQTPELSRACSSELRKYKDKFGIQMLRTILRNVNIHKIFTRQKKENRYWALHIRNIREKNYYSATTKEDELLQCNNIRENNSYSALLSEKYQRKELLQCNIIREASEKRIITVQYHQRNMREKNYYSATIKEKIIITVQQHQRKEILQCIHITSKT